MLRMVLLPMSCAHREECEEPAPVSPSSTGLNAETGPRVRRAAPAPAFQEGGELGIVGHVDHQGDELVAALAVLRGEALALEAKHRSRARSLGHAQHHRPSTGLSPPRPAAGAPPRRSTPANRAGCWRRRAGRSGAA